MVDPNAIQGHWVHSHEEDTASETVFRPSTHAFPPSRGRDEYDLQAGGVLSTTRPGPADRRRTDPGSWQFEDGNILVLQLPNGVSKKLLILSVDSERLIVSK